MDKMNKIQAQKADKVLSAVIQNWGISKSGLSEKIGIDYPTVSHVVDDLNKRGYLKFREIALEDFQFKNDGFININPSCEYFLNHGGYSSESSKRRIDDWIKGANF